MTVNLRILMLFAVTLLGGCATVGPASISNGRAVYNEVVNYTGDQEILNMIVRERYGQTYGMLDVASITANVKFSASVGGDFQAWGRDRDTDGNLIPLSVGAAYEENPTISYIPVKGELAMRQLVTPLSVEQAFLVMRAAVEKDVATRQMYASVNGIQNPIGKPATPEYNRLINLDNKLRNDHVINFGRAPDSEKMRTGYAVCVHNYRPEHYDDINEWLGLLGVEGHTVDGREIVIPMQLSFRPHASNGINVQLRSAQDWIRHAASMIDVPQPHMEMGIVHSYDWDPQGDNEFIKIRSSEKRPENATVAIQFRNWWYYIDATDKRSKNSFRMIKFLIRLRMDVKSGDHQVPVLTVPVG